MAESAATATIANAVSLGRRTLQTRHLASAVRANMDHDINYWCEVSLPAELEIYLGSPAPHACLVPLNRSPVQHAPALHGGPRD